MGVVNSGFRCLPPLQTKLDQTWIPVIPIAIPMRCKLYADSEGIFALGGVIISGLFLLGSVTFHAIMLQ